MIQLLKGIKRLSLADIKIRNDSAVKVYKKALFSL